MYGSFGSYSSLYSSTASSITSTSSAMDIAPSAMRYDNATCAYPSWPRRSALSGSSCTEQRATSYLSDDDLFPQDFEEDDARSVSSAGSSGVASPVGGMAALTEAQLAEMKRQQHAMQREYVKALISEKERRRAAAKKTKRSSSSSSSSKKSKRTSAMAPIVENGE